MNAAILPVLQMKELGKEARTGIQAVNDRISLNTHSKILLLHIGDWLLSLLQM